MNTHDKPTKQYLNVEGNNGGDYLKIYHHPHHDDNMVHLSIGHQCVTTVDALIPIEILTSILSDALCDLDRLSNMCWSKEYNTKLLTQLKTANEKVKATET